MRFAFFSFLLALVTASAMAVAPHKSVIISYPNDTPQSVVDDAMESIEKAGGKITHKYNIIKGFACEAPVSSLETVSVMNTEFAASIEEDGVVTTQNNEGGMGI
ncbi:hypothetical protein K505DRAFT_308170 [Melanomma pulvis-pyrius CBS 109.77]|uniref:Inhibitor I9 domain-containing protein n=1 Tax=Melanomma pulvis-pyrius CBS 109.77 TaxID=1314802 RepID=A0A6A6X7T1_9PLEO|nr:hypothetical protein K505DRAFT_308170 [Melanomma pulvis-pyrius CBS 109.77]